MAEGTEALKRSEKKQRDIVIAAEKVFIESGYQQASMNKIAEVACVTKRTIYKHFENKEALFDHIMRELINGMFAQTSIGYQADQALKPQLLAMLDAIWRVVSDERHIKLKRVVIAEYIRVPQFMAELLHDVYQRDGGLNEWLEGAIDAGHMRVGEDKALVFEFIVGLVERFAEIPRLYDQSIPEGEAKAYVLDQMADLIILKYGA